MTVAPATDAILPLALSLVRQAFLDAIIPATPDGRACWGMGGVFKDAPRVIVQPTGPGKAVRYIGMPSGWEGEIAVRAQTQTLQDCDALLMVAIGSLFARMSITDSDGLPWLLSLRSVRPIPGLPGPVSAVSGVVYLVRVVPV